MASRPKGFGLTRELAHKIESKYDVQLEIDAREWIESVIGQSIQVSDKEPSSDKLHEELKDGQVLCKLINVIKPGSVRKINDSKMAFKQMENIGIFLDACQGLGMSKTDLFQTVDLYERTNMPQVVTAIHALGRKAQKAGYDGPKLGVKEATQNIREFTEEQLRAGEGVIGLQAGSNKGASQAGQNFGKTRAILD